MRKGLWGRFGVVLCLTLMVSGFARAAESKDALKNAETAIRSGLLKLNDKLLVDTVSDTPINGVYQVVMKSGEVLYVSADGQYVFGGDLLKIGKNGLENLTEKIRSEQVRKTLAAQDPKDMIVFPAQGERKSVMYVFTDVDCGYCRKLHQEVPQLNSKGVEVRYLAFPRGGENAPAYSRMVSAWCAKDRKQAMTNLKSGQPIETLTCDNPVLDQYRLGASLGVRGTPALYLEDGRSIPGYQPADALLKLMGI
ncbi:DsbC family protein [Sansalvadorimonas sp. 2012CJ34-2]|uniref:Thiol:disulfide interchange protein n=1 Tax=Parendozoicomonas callyspongiae TaxID=2942213 RepID=A0ABT0PFL1_9GAMM|nr:DsbC family protein [Sansalvadorimonas sp. 2012CJ34-2]MCL6270167.1 DsbC family protein [Sansalvadorimonas sp. 2012CJ34-2]